MDTKSDARPNIDIGQSFFTIEGMGVVSDLIKQEKDESMPFDRWKLNVVLPDKKQVSLTGSASALDRWKLLSLIVKPGKIDQKDRFDDAPDPKKRKQSATPVALPPLIPKQVTFGQNPPIPPQKQEILFPIFSSGAEKDVNHWKDLFDQGKNLKRSGTKEEPIEISDASIFKNPYREEEVLDFTFNLRSSSPQTKKLFQKRTHVRQGVKIKDHDFSVDDDTIDFSKLQPKGSDEDEKEQEESSIASGEFPIDIEMNVLSLYTNKAKLDPQIRLEWMNPKANDLLLVDLGRGITQIVRTDFMDVELLDLPEESSKRNKFLIHSEMGKLFPMLKRIASNLKPKERTTIELDFDLFHKVVGWFYSNKIHLQHPLRFLVDISQLKYGTMMEIVALAMIENLKTRASEDLDMTLLSWLDDALDNDLHELTKVCLELLKETFSQKTIKALTWRTMREESMIGLYSIVDNPMKYQIDLALEGIESFIASPERRAMLKNFMTGWSFD